jgi:hypothetical protein
MAKPNDRKQITSQRSGKLYSNYHSTCGSPPNSGNKKALCHQRVRKPKGPYFMLAHSNSTTSRAPRANQTTIGAYLSLSIRWIAAILPKVTHITETTLGSNVFVCLVPSRTLKRPDGSAVVYKLHVWATWYPYDAECQCPGSRNNCAHKQVSIDAVEAYRVGRWQANQQKRGEKHAPLTWQLGNESAMTQGGF